jgi:rSAM/selenodomain-associated transferase 1
MNRAVIIMAKVPTLGTVKTRLQAILSPEKCTELSIAFLRDSINKAQTVCENLTVAFAPASQKKLLENIISPGVSLIEQKGENLGEKMSHAFDFVFNQESDSAVVMIGTDSPTFPAEYITEAFEALEKRAEIVLGKSKDGGFYLIGLRKLYTKLFDEIEWSTARVYRQITRNIDDLGIAKLKTVPENYDVDTPRDFLFMKDEILSDENLQKSAQESYRWLLKNKETI